MRCHPVGCLVVLLALLCGCVDDTWVDDSPLPYAPVQVELDLYGYDYHLTLPMSMVTIVHPAENQFRPVGHGGVLVVHTHGDNYSAYDLACPHEYPSIVRVEPLPSSEHPLTVMCPKCGTVYDLFTGMGGAVDGPSSIPLQLYRTSLYDGVLRVSH